MTSGPGLSFGAMGKLGAPIHEEPAPGSGVDNWQLEESTDNWQLEEDTSVWLLE